MWHVRDVGNVIPIFFECNAIYVKDIKNKSNTPHNFLNIQLIFNLEKVFESWN